MTLQEYIKIRKNENDFIWQNYEKHLYYNVKNQDCIFHSIIMCLIFIFFNGGIIIDIIIIFFTFLSCKYNNYLLSQDSKIIKERNQYILEWMEQKCKEEAQRKKDEERKKMDERNRKIREMVIKKLNQNKINQQNKEKNNE